MTTEPEKRLRIARLEPLWGALDQGVSSATNFLLFVVVARVVSPVSFGLFSLAFSVYVLGIGVVRSLAGEALLVRFAESSRSTFKQAVASQSGAALGLGLAFGLLAASGGALFGSGSAGLFLVLGFTLPGLILQDALRVAMFASGLPRRALSNDLVWGLLLGGLVVARPLPLSNFAVEMMAYWGLSGTVTGLIGLVQLAVFPRLLAGPKWLLGHRDLGLPYLLEFTIVTGSQQLLLALVAGISGAAAAGALKGAQLLMGPVNMLFTPAVLVGVRPAVEARSRSGDVGLRSFCRRVAALLFGLGVVWTGMLLLLPDSVGRRLLGESWLEAMPLLLPIGLSVAFSGCAVGALVGLRSLAAAKSAVRVRILVGGLMLASGFVGALWGGALGAAIGFAAINALGIWIWWRELSVSLRPGRTRRVGAKPSPPSW